MEAFKCIQVQESEICAQDPRSLGTTHCGSATIKYRNYNGVKDLQDGVIRGCINCAGT